MSYLIVILLLASLLIFAETRKPGRPLPKVDGWYWRVILFNVCQFLSTYCVGLLYFRYLSNAHIFSIQEVFSPPVQGFVAWFIGTFVFYWWHRLRHRSRFLWRVLHQIHHSPARIEALTSFYKHPLEIAINSLLSSLIIYFLLGASLEAAAWYNVFAASGELFYHSNIQTPRWIGYFLQRPEHHSVHHQRGVHHYNYGDITWWDRLFGTFKEMPPGQFAPLCGFKDHKEKHIFRMLCFKDHTG